MEVIADKIKLILTYEEMQMLFACTQDYINAKLHSNAARNNFMLELSKKLVETGCRLP